MDAPVKSSKCVVLFLIVIMNNKAPSKAKVLPNRYNYYVALWPTSNIYKFVADERATNHYRIGFNDDKSIAFIDPPGGPMLHVGYEVEGCGKLKSIIPTDSEFLLIF
jgi:hypothetical protein